LKHVGGGKINACPLNISKLSFISVWVRIYFSESMELNTEPADLKIESADFLSLVMWTVQLSSVTVYWGHMRLNILQCTKSSDVKPQALYFQKKNLFPIWLFRKDFKSTIFQVSVSVFHEKLLFSCGKIPPSENLVLNNKSSLKILFLMLNHLLLKGMFISKP